MRTTIQPQMILEGVIDETGRIIVETRQKYTKEYFINLGKDLLRKGESLLDKVRNLTSFVKRHIGKAAMAFCSTVVASTFTSGVMAAIGVGSLLYAAVKTLWDYIKRKKENRPIDVLTFVKNVFVGLVGGIAGTAIFWWIVPFLLDFSFLMLFYAYYVELLLLISLIS